jgi:hypothetical protein
MLNFVEVQRQLMGMVQEQASRRQDFGQRIGIAEQEAKRWTAGYPHLVRKIAGSKTSWLVASFQTPPPKFFRSRPVPNDGLSLRRTARKFSPTATRR